MRARPLILFVVSSVYGCAGFDFGMRTKHDDPPARSTSVSTNGNGKAPEPQRTVRTVESQSNEDAQEVIRRHCPDGHVETDFAYVPVTRCQKKWERGGFGPQRCETSQDIRIKFYCA
jgi:hypothetical protein